MKNSTASDRSAMTTSRDPVRLLALMLVAVSLAACGSAAPAGPKPKPKRNAEGITFSSLAPDVYSPCGLAALREAVWVLACAGKAVKVGPGGERIARAIEGDLVGLDALSSDGSRSLYVLVARGSGSQRRGAVVPVDAEIAEPKAAIELGTSIPMHAAFAGGKTWIAGIDGGVFTVDGDMAAKRIASGPPLVFLATDGTRIWTVAENGDVVERLGDGSATKTFSGVLPNAIAAAAGEGSVWIAAATSVVRLDASTGTATRVDVAGTVNHIEACGGSVWLSQPDFGLRSVDATGKVQRSIETSEGPSYLACDGSKLWVLTENGSLGSIDVTN